MDLVCLPSYSRLCEPDPSNAKNGTAGTKRSYARIPDTAHRFLVRLDSPPSKMLKCQIDDAATYY